MVPHRSRSPAHGEKDVVKIAALLQVHHRADLLAHLLGRLWTTLWNVYVHVDRKTDIAPFAALSDRAVFLQRRKRVFWAGFSQAAATLLLLRRAYRDTENTHFYLTSGQCFPIKSDGEIERRLGSCGGNFMSAVKMPTRYHPLARLTRWHCNDVQYGKLHRLNEALFRRLPDRNLSRLLRGMEPWSGSSWWMLNRQTVSEILDFVSQNRWYLRAFRYSHCPDECFFQTLVQHLRIVVDGSCPTVDRWVDGNAHPEVLTPELLAEMTSGWHFAARKFDRLPSELTRREDEPRL
jgi:hypothetical protein